ncbi:MAG TPA: amino acid permease, partial [Gemmatimonadales bacterium]|nr:amino acid permease [Gemmatimonadales bacterium]
TLIRASALGGISITFAQYAMRSAGYDPSVAPYDQYARYLAAVAVLVAAGFNIRGVKWGSMVTNVTTIAKFGGLMFIVILALAIGLPQSGGANFTPAVPPGSFAIAPFGLALVSVLWAFDGWADLSFVSGEVKDPQRNLPRALIGGTVAVLAISLAANVGYLSVLSVEEIRRSPLVAADAAERLVGAWGVAFVGLTVMVSTFGTLNAVLLTSPRIFFAAADDGLFFRPVAAVHPTYKTPWVAIGMTAALAVAFVLLRTFEQLADTFVTAIIPFYALAIASIYVLRRQRGYAPSFRVPGYPLIPALFILSTIFILANAVISPSSRWPTLAVMGVILLGVPVYFATVGRRAPAREGA